MQYSNSGKTWLIMKGLVVVYSTLGCPHCQQAKHTLKEKGIEFTEVSLDRFPPSVSTWLRDRTGVSSVPQIFFNEKLIGGNDELQKLMGDDTKLEEMVEYVMNESCPKDESAPLVPSPGMALAVSEGSRTLTEDAYAPLVQDLISLGMVSSLRSCFAKKMSGVSFVDWMVEKKLISRERAAFIGGQLIKRRFIVPTIDVEDDHFRDSDRVHYRLVIDTRQLCLNTDQLYVKEQREPSQLAEEMRQSLLALYSKHISENGLKVDYQALAEDPNFQRYKELTVQLQRVNLRETSELERKAFFMNVYNALVIHGNVVRGPPSNVVTRMKFFTTVAYNIGGHVFSLNTIEHGILRSNRSSIGTLYLKPLGKGDSRRRLMLSELDARIHFGLNCGAKSCPPIKTFDKANLDDQLEVATKSYLEGNDALRIEDKRKIVRLSKLFDWYGSDFGSDDGQRLRWVADHIDNEAKAKKLRKLANSPHLRVLYLDYNWGHNAKH